MIRTLGVLAMVGVLFGVCSVVWAGKELDVHDGSAITITSPQNGATVGRSFELKYVLRKGLQASHAHAYVDGKYQKGFKGVVQNVSPGRHTVTVKVANENHDVLAVSDSIEVIVE